MLLINIAVRLILYTDNIVVGYLYGAAAASIYYTTWIPATVGYNIINRLTDNAYPAINELYAKKDTAALKRAFLRLSRYTFLMVAPLVLGLLLFNRTVIEIWVGPQQYAGNMMTIALVIFVVLNTVGHVSNAFVIAIGQVGILSLLALVEGILNIGLSLWLGKLLGLPGVMFATVFANMITTSYLQWKGMKLNQIHICEYLCLTLKPIIIPVVASATITILAIYVLEPSGWLLFIAAAMTLVSIYFILAYFTGLDTEERNWLKKRV